MQLIWDDAKRERNIEVHGFDFADAYLFDWYGAEVSATYPSRSGRMRRIATGFLFDQVVTIIFSPLGTEAYSIISMRRASRKERRKYERH